MPKKFSYKTLSMILAVVLVLQSVPALFSMAAGAGREETQASAAKEAVLSDTSVTDSDDMPFSEDNKANDESSLKIKFNLQLPVNSDNPVLKVNIPEGIELDENAGSLSNGDGMYNISEIHSEDNILTITFENQQGNEAITEDSLELSAHFSEDVQDYVEDGVLTLEFEDEANTKIEIPFAESTEDNESSQAEAEDTAQATETEISHTEEEETSQTEEEGTSQTEENAISQAEEDETSQIEQTEETDTSNLARDNGISLFGANEDSGIMFTDITDFSSDAGIATMTYVNTINSDGSAYKKMVVGANFGDDFDTSAMSIKVYEIVNNSGTSTEVELTPGTDYTLSGNAITFTNTETRQFVIKYENISTQTSYLNSYGSALDSGTTGTASFTIDTIDNTNNVGGLSYNRNFQPLTLDTEGQDTSDPSVVKNINLHLNTILTGFSSTTAAANQEIEITYEYSLNNLVYALDTANKMNDTLDDSQKGIYDGKLNVHAGDYYIFEVDTSKISIGNNASGELKKGGTTIGYYSLNAQSSTMAFIFTRQAELEADITSEITIKTVTSSTLVPGDTITAQINDKGETSIVIYLPSIEIHNYGERDDANNQVIWTIEANHENYEVKNMVIFDNRSFADEGSGTTNFELTTDRERLGYGITGLAYNNYWEFGDDSSFKVEEIDGNGNLVKTLLLNTDYEITSGASVSGTTSYDCQRYIKLIGAYATTSATIRVTITGDMTGFSNIQSNSCFMNYTSVSGSNITTSVADDIAINVDDGAPKVISATGSAYIPSVFFTHRYSEHNFIDNNTRLKITYETVYNINGIDVDPYYADVTIQPTNPYNTDLTAYSAYINSNSQTVSYMTFDMPISSTDIRVESYVGSNSTETPISFTENIDYTVEITPVTISSSTQYVVKIKFNLNSNTSTDGVHINVPTKIYYDQYTTYNMPSNAVGLRFQTYAVAGTGYATSGNKSMRGFYINGNNSYIGANTLWNQIVIYPDYIAFEDGYCIYDILPQGNTLIKDSFSITAREDFDNWFDLTGTPNVVLRGNTPTSLDILEGYFELVMGEDFGTISGNVNYDKDKDFYLIFHAGSKYTDSLVYTITYYTSIIYESQDSTGSTSKDYANSTGDYNRAYLYKGLKDSASGGYFTAYYSTVWNYASTSSTYRYFNTNIASAGGYTRSVLPDDQGNGGSDPTLTWRVYGNIWNNSLDGAVLNQMFGPGSKTEDGNTTKSSLTQTLDTSSVKLYIFTRADSGGTGTSEITSDTGDVTVPAGTIGTINLLDSSYNLGITLNTSYEGLIQVSFPADYTTRLKNSGIEGTVDAYGNVNTRFVLVYETVLNEVDIEYPYYLNTTYLSRKTTTSDNNTPFQYVESIKTKVEITEFTDDTYKNTKIGEYDGNEKLIHYTAILNKGAQTISDDGAGTNPTIHDTLYYTANENTGAAEQQILYLIESTLKVYEAERSSDYGYTATKELELGVDYNLVYNQDALNGFDIVFTDEYGSVVTPIIVEYDAAYNHIQVPAYVENGIYLIGYETYTTDPTEVYVSETTVTSGWARQLVDIQILKVDENGDPMEGVKFALVDKDGAHRIESQTTDINGVAMFANVLEDTYLIYEVDSPDGYGNSYNTLQNAASFTVTSNRISTNPEEYEFTISLPNGVDNGSLILQYEDSGTTAVANTVTVSEDDLDTTYLKFINNSGYIANVEATKYAPYEIDPVTGTGNLLTDAEFYVYRYYEDSSGVVVKKYYKDNGSSANNDIAVFTENVNDAYTFDTTANGKFTIENLPVGQYYLEEITTPAGYKAPSTDFAFEITKSMIDDYISANPTATTYTFKEEVPNFKSSGSITINKKNANDEFLSGAYFLLEADWDEDGIYTPIYYNTGIGFWEEITDGSTYSAITDIDGQIVFKTLPEGDYKITEIKTSSADYALMTEPIYVTIPYELEVNAGTDPNTLSEGYDQGSTIYGPSGGFDYYYYYNLTFEIINSNVWGLPEAGEFNNQLPVVIFAGLACVLVSATLYVARRRRSIKHHSRE